MLSTALDRGLRFHFSASLSVLACLLSAPPAAAQAALADDWLAEVSAQVPREEYQFTALGADLWSAPNRSGGLRACIDRNGIEVFSRAAPASGESAGWSLHLRTSDLGRDGQLQPLACGTVSATGSRAEIDHGALVEWFINDERGIEQGWTIAQRPEGIEPLVIGLAIEGELSLRLDDDRRSGAFVDAAGVPRGSYSHLVAWDATGRALDVWLAGRSGGLEVWVDDRQARYPITIDPLIVSADWSVGIVKKLAYFGYSVSSAGDVNGDGFDDVIAGAWHSGANNSTGRAHLYLGSATGLDRMKDWFATPGQTPAHFGFSVSDAGDVNGDGYDDVIIGAYAFANGELNEGRAFVYHGSPSGLSSSADWTAESNQAQSFFGYSVSGAGDVNGDGFDDVIVGAIKYQDGEIGEGRAFAYHGSATGLSSTAAWIAEPNSTHASFGSSVSNAGDINNDGYDDVIVGAEWYSNGEANEGRVYAYHGSPAGLSPTAAWTFESNVNTANLGRSISSAGDINGDGFADVILAASNGTVTPGRAYVFHGSASGLAEQEAWSTGAPPSLKKFARSVAGAGDINGDGYADVVVGASGSIGSEPNEGHILVYLGSASGLARTAAWTAESNQAGAQLGTSAASAGDVNGDGLADIIAGAPFFDNFTGRLFVYHGSTPPPPSPYCTAGTSASGCIAQLSAAGLASATRLSGFTLDATSVEGQARGLFFFGTSGRQANAWGNGTSLQCVAPPVQRTTNLPGVGDKGHCNAAFSEDLNALWCPSCPLPALNPGAGAVVQAQLWYRDPSSTSNQPTSLSGAIEFTVAP